MIDYDPDAPKTADEIEMEATIAELVDRLNQAREGSAEYKIIMRQLTSICHGSELGTLASKNTRYAATWRCLGDPSTLVVVLRSERAHHRPRHRCRASGFP